VTTGIHIGDRMRIVIDDEIISAPHITSSIKEGSVQITGVFCDR
jgi:preprotein translocase subunit SecD